MPEVVTDKQDPVLLLLEIDRRSRARAAHLPRQEVTKAPWDGIGFRIGSLRLVAALGQVGEVLPCPGLTRVPGTKPWVVGVANVRGAIVPVMDLSAFLFGFQTAIDEHSRILLVEHQGSAIALLTDAVLGMRHFDDEEWTRELPETREWVRPYLHGSFRRDGELWGVFDLRALVTTPEFLQVAA